MTAYIVTVNRVSIYHVTVDNTQTEPQALAADYARQLAETDSPGGQTASTVIRKLGSKRTTITCPA